MSNNQKDNFPYFLYEDHPDLIEAAKYLRLSPKMMEIYCYYFYMTYIVREKIKDYNFFNKYGGFRKTMRIIEEIKSRIRLYNEENYSDFDLQYDIYDYGIMNPGKAFVFCELKPHVLYENIEMLFDVKRKTISKEFTSGYFGKRMVRRKSAEQFKHWEIREFPAKHYLKQGKFPICITNYEKEKRYFYRHAFLNSVIRINDDEIDVPKYQLTDYEEVKKCFYIEIRENPVIEYFQDYYLCLTPIGEKFVEWINKEE